MKITAVYPDKSKFEITSTELDNYLKDECVEWKKHFYISLYERGIAYGPIAKYFIKQS